jgi:hypothetical protein
LLLFFVRSRLFNYYQYYTGTCWYIATSSYSTIIIGIDSLSSWRRRDQVQFPFLWAYLLDNEQKQVSFKKFEYSMMMRRRRKEEEIYCTV